MPALEIAEASRNLPQYVLEALSEDLQGDTETPLFLLEEPLFADVLRWRTRCVAHFLERLRDLIKGIRAECKLSAALVPPVRSGIPNAPAPGWHTDVPRIARGDTLHCVIHWDADGRLYTRGARRTAPQI